MMNTYDENDEEELYNDFLQLSIQDSCQEAFLKSAASLGTATDENLRVLAAIEQGDVSLLRGVLRDPSTLGELDSRGWLPLHRAAAQPEPQVLETLLGWDPRGLEERTVSGGETPLTLAVRAGLEQNVRRLLEHGASPQRANARNETPLLLGCKNLD
ncbi:ankyrin repeat and SOCS box protein 15-like [Menidia menidia]